MGLVFIIYLIGVLPSLGDALSFLGFMGCLVSVVIFVLSHIEDAPEDLRTYCFFKTFVVIWLLGFMVPEEKTMYTMLAAYGVNEVITNPKVQELGGKSLEVLEKAMDEYIGEDKGEAK